MVKINGGAKMAHPNHRLLDTGKINIASPYKELAFWIR